MKRLTDEEVFREYAALMSISLDKMPSGVFQALVSFVKIARKDEPRINSGVHYHDYTMICDNDDGMDSFYGPNYFEENSDGVA